MSKFHNFMTGKNKKTKKLKIRNKVHFCSLIIKKIKI